MARQVIIRKASGFAYAGTWRFRGEVIDLQGHPNDQRLQDIGYVQIYDGSQHDRTEEVEEAGRRFVGPHFRVEFLKVSAEREAEERAKRLRHLPRVDQELDMESEAIARAGLEPASSRGAKPVSLAGIDPPAREKCPICEDLVETEDMRDHVADEHGSEKQVSEIADPRPVKSNGTVENARNMQVWARKQKAIAVLEAAAQYEDRESVLSVIDSRIGTLRREAVTV